MPIVDKNPDGSLTVRIFYADLSVEAVTEIDECLAEYGRGMLYDHIIEEFAMAAIDINAPDPVASLANPKKWGRKRKLPQSEVGRAWAARGQ